jgi:hypothetical protein
MSTLEMEPTHETHEQARPTLWQRASRALLHLVTPLPDHAPDSLSEHFGHAEKRNDPKPDVQNFTT